MALGKKREDETNTLALDSTEPEASANAHIIPCRKIMNQDLTWV